jgi:carbonic anhydrase
MRIFALTLLLLSAAASCAAQNAPWSYEGADGPLRWGKLDPAYQSCEKGREQSPIDIRGAKLNKTLAPIEFHYLTGSVTLANDGRTIVGKVRPGSYIVANGERYELEQFTFHHPGEEAVGGKLTVMDVQLLHRSAQGKLAVVAVRMAEDRNRDNTVLAALWPHLPQKAGASETVTEMVNLRGLLPASRGYWSYAGSLTTPPCTEGVRWFVMEDEIGVGRDQARFFTDLFKMNSRPLQDPHGRRIEASE